MRACIHARVNLGVLLVLEAFEFRTAVWVDEEGGQGGFHMILDSFFRPKR